MSPLLIVLALACALLAVAVGVLVLALVAARRRVAEQQRVHGDALDVLGGQLAELTTRQAELEAAGAPAAADYVITFDRPDPAPVPAPWVVSTALGEPLIKAVAFGHGVRHALREEKRAHLVYQVRREYRRRRRATRAAARRSVRRA